MNNDERILKGVAETYKLVKALAEDVEFIKHYMTTHDYPNKGKQIGKPDFSTLGKPKDEQGNVILDDSEPEPNSAEVRYKI